MFFTTHFSLSGTSLLEEKNGRERFKVSKIYLFLSLSFKIFIFLREKSSNFFWRIPSFFSTLKKKKRKKKEDSFVVHSTSLLTSSFKVFLDFKTRIVWELYRIIYFFSINCSAKIQREWKKARILHLLLVFCFFSFFSLFDNGILQTPYLQNEHEHESLS